MHQRNIDSKITIIKSRMDKPFIFIDIFKKAILSISAGLDYPGIGPEHAYLHDIGRAEYVPATDRESVDAFMYLSKTEGIIPAVESAHALAYAMKLAPTLDKDKIIVVNLSGRGDKDVAAIARYLGRDLHE